MEGYSSGFLGQGGQEPDAKSMVALLEIYSFFSHPAKRTLVGLFRYPPKLCTPLEHTTVCPPGTKSFCIGRLGDPEAEHYAIYDARGHGLAQSRKGVEQATVWKYVIPP